ncbi:MAG: hypothetical protein ACP5OB_03950 [Candidatus Ratteibacteria bacterium]
MKNIYSAISEVSSFEKEENHLKKIKLYIKKKLVGEIFLPYDSSSILVVLPQAGYNEKTKKWILRQLMYLLEEEKIGLCIANYGNHYFKKTDEEFFDYFKKSISEIRGIILFIREKLKIEKIDIMGLSFGGILGFILAAVEEKIKKCIFLISGGNFEYITWRSVLRFILKKDCSRITCKNMHKIYKKFLQKKMYDEIFNLPRKCFLYDPVTFLEYLKEKDILMINGLFDMVIPFFSVLEIKRKVKNIKILWYPGTHLTFRYFFPFFKNSVLRFLKNGNKCRC